MDFNGIMGNLVASAIYTLLCFLVAWIFQTRQNKNEVAASTVNPTQYIQIINFPPQKHTHIRTSSNGTPSEWGILLIIAFMLLTYLSLVYKSQIINFGYITFSFGVIISILIIYGVQKVVKIPELPIKDKIGLFFPVIYWCIFLVININLGSPIISDSNIKNVEQVIVNGGWDGLGIRFFNISSTANKEFLTIILKFLGLGLLYISWVYMIRFQLFFILNWVVNIKNRGQVNSFIMWFYRRTFIYNVTGYIFQIIFILLFSFVFVNGFVYLILPNIQEFTP
ncbi:MULTISPECIES: hypothetical protein [unclassified Bacillus (in: firmicutes)]|uniref:hypothetical protein n=1 Tax=unclassified Bacillus (in: firmicutes) TaxID=185979 RepID=UPI0008F2A32F|nr:MULTISPECIES: hypothetical protein [unclassified Bacillus (in: firmicutes)]SFI35658.1 hypothetical protein SAMN04488574_102444 [Bacillus sp. 71mf]SFS35134.1 hypothetical protein SAMN04488145_10121 [Bacillus sp. 103mf]